MTSRHPSKVISEARAWRIEWSRRSRVLSIDTSALKRLIRRVLNDVVYPPPLGLRTRGFLPPPPEGVTELSVVVVGDREMTDINGRFRKKPKPTDVLSFPQLSPGASGEIPDFSGIPLGDLVISEETLIRQADARDLTYGEELLRLVIHGILHLLGYDHEKVPPSEAARMRRIERRLWQRYRPEARSLVRKTPKRRHR